MSRSRFAGIESDWAYWFTNQANRSCGLLYPPPRSSFRAGCCIANHLRNRRCISKSSPWSGTAMCAILSLPTRRNMTEPDRSFCTLGFVSSSLMPFAYFPVVARCLARQIEHPRALGPFRHASVTTCSIRLSPEPLAICAVCQSTDAPAAMSTLTVSRCFSIMA